MLLFGEKLGNAGYGKKLYGMFLNTSKSRASEEVWERFQYGTEI
jgi:hypothetical protein